MSARARERLEALTSRLATIGDPWDSTRRSRFAGVGLSMIELTPQLARHFGVDDGVLISTVLEDSPSARAGLRAGDVITAIDSHAVHSRADAVREISSAARNGSVAVEISRDKKRSTLKLNPAAPNNR
jgi:S1-C subfamily serine protease